MSACLHVTADLTHLLQTKVRVPGAATAHLWAVSIQHIMSHWSLCNSCYADPSSNPSTSGATPSTSGGKAEEQADAESLEDREFRQAVQARRKSPLDTSSSYRSTASSDDSSDPDNPAHSPGTPADKAKWQSKKRTGHQLRQHASRLVQLRALTLVCFTAGICMN